MLVTNSKNTRRGTYDGFITHLLIGESNSGSKEISLQITDVEPNKMQILHAHAQEQCYFIISGFGKMIINDQTQDVQKGDAIFIPSNAVHGIENVGEEVLTYLTANQAFGLVKEAELWPDTIEI